MTEIAAESVVDSTGTAVRTRTRRHPRLVRFFAFDGSARVVIETDNEDDAQDLCRQMAWDFICFCD